MWFGMQLTFALQHLSLRFFAHSHVLQNSNRINSLRNEGTPDTAHIIIFAVHVVILQERSHANSNKIIRYWQKDLTERYTALSEHRDQWHSVVAS